MKFILVIALALFTYDCGKKKPAPLPLPSPTPVQTPTPPLPDPSPSPVESPSSSPSPTTTPTAQPTATPFPTPQIDPQSFIPAPKQGSTVRLQGEEGEDYSAKIQAVMDNSANVAQVVLGPGTLRRSIIARTHTHIETTREKPLVCELSEDLPQFKMFPRSDYGCILIESGVHVSGNFTPPHEMLDYFAKGNGHQWRSDPYAQKLLNLSDDAIHGNASTVLEPEFSLGPSNPGIFVFQAINDVGSSHTGQSENIAVTGIVVQGRQKTYDGGVRATATLGNCKRCSFQNMFLRDTGSIGLQAGGSAIDSGNHASDFLFWHNITSGVAAANIAMVNASPFYVMENFCRRPGRPEFGGGVSCVDMETNSPADYSGGWIVNNLADYEGARAEGAGSAFLAQDPYVGPNRKEVVIANNVAIGGRDDVIHRYMSNGYYLVGLQQCKVVNNYVFRTGQNAIQAYATNGCLVQDNDFESTGGGGQFTIQFYGVTNTTVRRSNFRTTLGLPINTQAGFSEVEQSCGNLYEENLVDGRAFSLSSPACPARTQGPTIGGKVKYKSGSSWKLPE